ncbi:GTP-binding protein [Zafaria sp. Z1313]|uniref:GTP-binding protein n=1 Tax=Zafaria sp. Z1313 TaxID=3423202 RepID=UPI003D302381
MPHGHPRALALAVDPASVEDQLWDRHTLWESGLSSLPADDRTAGEFLIEAFAQCREVLLVEGLFAHLLGGGSAGCQSGGAGFVQACSSSPRSPPRARLLHAELGPGTEPPTPGSRGPFGTVELRAGRPLQANRFRATLPRIAEGVAWLRGDVWLADSPTARLGVTGIGPRVWMEHLGTWGRRAAGTRLLMTGPDMAGAAEEAAAALAACELTDAELSRAGTTGAPHGAPSENGSTIPGGTP